jgi:hypothetical protein
VNKIETVESVVAETNAVVPVIPAAGNPGNQRK